MRRLALPGWRWLRLGLLMAVVIVAACSSGDDKGTAQPGEEQFVGTIRIGAVLDLSGPVGSNPLGLSQVRGAERAVEDINAAGGVQVGGQRYRLEFLKFDSRSDGVAANAAAQEAIQRGVIALAVATCPYFNQVYGQFRVAGILTWTVCPPGLNLIDPDTRFYEGVEKNPFLFAAIDFAEPIIIGWIKQIYKLNPDIKRISFLLDDGPLGRGMAPAVEKAAGELGLEFVGGVHYPVGTTDYSTYITNVRGRRPDLVYAGTGGGAAVELPVQAVKLNIAPFLIVAGMRPADLTPIGDLGNTTIVMTDWRLPYHKEVAPREYLQKVEKLGVLETGFPVQVGFAVAYYDFVQLLAKAIEKAGTAKDPAAIAKALPGLSVESYLGGQTVILQDHSTRGSMGNVIVTKDKFTVYIYKDARTDISERSYTVPR